jgi:hypothetical protein
MTPVKREPSFDGRSLTLAKMAEFSTHIIPLPAANNFPTLIDG